MAVYNNAGSFRMWCRMNLQDYRDDLNYEELLSKSITFLQTLINNTTVLTEEMTARNTIWNALIGYNANYPTTDDEINAVNNQLDKWAYTAFNALLEAGTQYYINQEANE